MNKILLAAGMVFWWMASVVIGISVLEPSMRAISLLPGVNEDRISWVIELIFALVTGIVQWLFLRRLTPLAGWWVVFSLVAGAALGIAVGVGVQVPSAEVAAIPLCVGGIPGIGMALLLWGKSSPRQAVQEFGR